MKNKENAQKDFIEMIEKSWTFDRMTETEKADCMRVLTEYNSNAVKGTHRQRFEILNAVYLGFLAGLGYLRNPRTWREENPENIPFSQS